MKETEENTKTCTQCGRTLPLGSFARMNKEVSKVCLGCAYGEATEGDDSGGGGGPKHTKRFYDDFRKYGEKAARIKQDQEYKEEKLQTAREEKTQEYKEDKELTQDQKEKKQKKAGGFFQRIREGSSLFGAKPDTEKTTRKGGEVVPDSAKDRNDVLNAADYLSAEIHANNGNVLDQTGVRATENLKHWATSGPVQSQVNRNRAMVNPYNTFQQASFSGFISSNNANTANNTNKPQQQPDNQNSVQNVINNWRPPGRK